MSSPNIRYSSNLERFFLARVAELVDARDLKSLESNLVPVRLRPWAYEYSKITNSCSYCVRM